MKYTNVLLVSSELFANEIVTDTMKHPVYHFAFLSTNPCEKHLPLIMMA